MGIQQPILNKSEPDSNLIQENLYSLTPLDKNDFIKNWLDKIEINNNYAIPEESPGKLNQKELKKESVEFNFRDQNLIDNETSDFSDLCSLNTSESVKQNTSNLNEMLGVETLTPKRSTEKEQVHDEFKSYLEFLIEKEKIKPKHIIYLKQTKSLPKRLDPMRAILIKDFTGKKSN